MNVISILIIFPLIASIMVFLVRKDTIRNILVNVCAAITAILTLITVSQYFNDGMRFSFQNEHMIDIFIMIVEVIMAVYIISMGIKNKKYLVALFAIIQTPLIMWFEFTQKEGIEVEYSMVFDKLSAIMVLVVGIVGSLICIYAVGYMKWYHVHHDKYPERKSFFFAVVFLFLSAMFGLVLSNNLMMMYFCWEITSFCSYLLIGYTKTEEAKNNSFRALTINVGGGLAFAVAIALIGTQYNTLELSTLIALKPEGAVLIPVFLLCMAALTKSAQLPFSSWLLGAMVAPTPSSALLHSATMVKAGVYMIIRLAPMLGTTSVGRVVTLVGAVTFLASSLMAIAQSDGKKVLAYSTIANLGLIVMCASVGTQESIWAAIMLVVFHAISKSLLFLSVGSIEHQIGNRDIENMDVLLHISKRLAIYMLIGISGMFLAPFGMLISKWAAMKAFIDSDNMLIVVILAYGSAATLFYWTKWMGKLVANANIKKKSTHKFHLEEEVPIFMQSVLVVSACFAFPVISKFAIVPYLSDLFAIENLTIIGMDNVKIMLLMLAILLILPLSFLPILKNDKRRIAPIYMAGENVGDNESFYGAMKVERKVGLRNWYMQEYFGSDKLTFCSNMLSLAILGMGIILLIMGVAK